MSDARSPSRTVRHRAFCLLMTGLLLAGACSGDRGDPVQPDPCARQPRLEISGGTRPTFSWTPACPFTYLSVSEVTPGSEGYVTWTTGAPAFVGGMMPPVQYPASVPGDLQVLPLVSGRQYRVRISSERLTDSGFCLMNCPTTTLWMVEATFAP